MKYGKVSAGLMCLVAGSAVGQTGTLLGSLAPNSPVVDGLHGDSIDIDGNIVVVGAPGFTSVGPTFFGSITIFDVSDPVNPSELYAFSGLANNDNFGSGVGVSGNTVVAGTRWDDSPTSDSTITFFDALTGARSAPVFDGAGQGSSFGEAVAIHGSNVLVGAPSASSAQDSSIGAAFLVGSSFPYVVSGPIYSPTPVAEENFSTAVDLSSSLAFVGAPTSYDADSNSEPGEVNVYDLSGIFQRRITPLDGVGFDHFGFSVSADDADGVLVGAPLANGTGSDSESGAAYLFRASDGVQLQKFVADDASTNDHFGYSVEIAGIYAIVGAPGTDNPGAPSGGSVYIFELSTGNQLMRIDAPNSSDRGFGTSVAASGPYFVVGASGFNQFDFSNGSDGSAYIFDLRCNAADLAAGYGELDQFDISAFTAAYGNMDPIADLNNDGFFDFFDVSAFLTLVGQGCP